MQLLVCVRCDRGRFRTEWEALDCNPLYRLFQVSFRASEASEGRWWSGDMYASGGTVSFFLLLQK